MKTYPECYACLFRQAVTVVNETELSREIQIQSLKNVLQTLKEADPSHSPSAIAGDTNRVLRETLGIEDFYKEEKAANHKLALSFIDQLRRLLSEGPDALEQGLKISASGNVIDIIHSNEYDLWQEVKDTVGQKLMGGGLKAFKQRIDEVPHILYLADNVGETIFDRVFIETLDIPVIYAVKSGPILNDAALEDALAAGIDEIAEVIETGSQSPGTILSQCSPEFQDIFERSDLVISKGQANYETLDENGDKVFFLLRVKCPVLGRQLEAPIASLVLKQGQPVS
jgi:uncharacterized protein with ATP-grasp and redox domains